MKEISVVKSETRFHREAIKVQRGKLLKENSVIVRIRSSVKLLIMQNCTDNTTGNTPLTEENV